MRNERERNQFLRADFRRTFETSSFFNPGEVMVGVNSTDLPEVHITPNNKTVSQVSLSALGVAEDSNNASNNAPSRRREGDAGSITIQNTHIENCGGRDKGFLLRRLQELQQQGLEDTLQVGGRLQLFVQAWKELVKDLWTINLIQNGLELD